MIEQDIFKAIKDAFLQNELLKNIKLTTFVNDALQKPCVAFLGDALGAHGALINLEIQSDYKGAAESTALRKEIRKLLNTGSLRDSFYGYAFKEEGSSKNNILTFRTKRFRTGE